jgi:hypothetical protein
MFQAKLFFDPALFGSMELMAARRVDFDRLRAAAPEKHGQAL